MFLNSLFLALIISTPQTHLPVENDLWVTNTRYLYKTSSFGKSIVMESFESPGESWRGEGVIENGVIKVYWINKDGLMTVRGTYRLLRNNKISGFFVYGGTKVKVKEWYNRVPRFPVGPLF